MKKLFLAIAIWVGGCAALNGLTGQDAVPLVDTGVQIADCQSRGKEAGSYKVYDNCMREAGLRD